MGIFSNSSRSYPGMDPALFGGVVPSANLPGYGLPQLPGNIPTPGSMAPGGPAPIGPLDQMQANAIGDQRQGGQMPAPDGNPGLRPSVLSDQPLALKPMDTSQLIQNIQAKTKPDFFDKDGGWKPALSNVLLGLGASFGNPMAIAQIRQNMADKAAEREQQQWAERHKIERGDAIDDRNYDANKSQYFDGSTDRMKYDPATGTVSTIYDAPTAEEAYAKGMGYEPRTDQYRGAMKDYRLRSWGDTALGNRQIIEGIRFANRKELRQTPTYSNLHPTRGRSPSGRGPKPPTAGTVLGAIMAKMSKGQQLSPAEQQTLDRFKPQRTDPFGSAFGTSPAPAPTQKPAQASSGVRIGQTARNPKTGATITYTGKGWVDSAGRPVR